MMRIDLTCPVELLSASLPEEEDQVCVLGLFNLTDRTVSSAEATVRLMDSRENEREKVSHRARALNGRPHSAFRMFVPCAPAANAVRAEVTVDKVWFTDNAVWRREEGRETEYEPNNLPISQALTSLRYLAGETAVGFPSRQENVWVCVCGRPNDPNDIWCARCLRDREMIFGQFNPEAVESRMEQKEHQLDLRSRSVREDTARLQRIREENYNILREKQSRRRRVAVWAGCGLLAAALSLGVFRPWAGLLIGSKYLDQENLPAAERALSIAKGFPGSAELLAECRLRQARKDAAESTDPSVLTEAEKLLRTSGEASDTESADRILETRAELLLKAGDPDGAEALLNTLPETWPGLTEKLTECRWTRAESNREKRFFDSAREEYLALGDYREAADRAAECLYLPAMEMIENGEYDAALDKLGQIPDYQDSREQIRRCNYLKGNMLEKAGDRDGAIACFRTAEGYEDAKTRADALLRSAADESYASGNLDAALTLYEQLTEDPEAVEKTRECARTLAQTAYKNAEYLRAVELLDKLPAGDSDALRQKSLYQAGRAALKRGENQEAAELLERAGDYRDAEKYLNSARYARAGELVDQGNPEEAERLMTLLGEEWDDPDDLRTGIRYLKLEQAEENGEKSGETLAKEWLAFGNFKDARERGLRLYYQLASEAESQNRTLAAAELYGKAGEYEDAAVKSESLYDIYYGPRSEEIRTALADGDRELAITLLDSMDLTRIPEKYRELSGLKEKTVYELANSLYKEWKPYEALVWYRQIPEYRDVADRLERNCYLILGIWTDSDGNRVAEFREDGSCFLNGEELIFNVKDPYYLYTAKPGEELTHTWGISAVNAQRLSLSDQKTGKIQYMNREAQTAP